MVNRWFEGVYLVGRFNWFETGVWLLTHNGEAAVLELPPASITGLRFGRDPVGSAVDAAEELGASVKFILCTHSHLDHFHRDTFRRMRDAFPGVVPVLQSGFRECIRDADGVRYFDEAVTLDLGGEPLHLVHAPKHSPTDTMVIFRGAACTGDWELGTIRTLNERVPVDTRVRSCERMIGWAGHTGYRVHRVFSAHANDRREGVDWAGLMAATREDRKLW